MDSPSNLLDSAVGISGIFGVVVAIVSLPRSKMIAILIIGAVAVAIGLLSVAGIGFADCLRQAPWQELILAFTASGVFGYGHGHVSRLVTLIMSLGLLLVTMITLAVLCLHGPQELFHRFGMLQSWLPAMHNFVTRIVELRFLSVAILAGFASGIGVNHFASVRK